MTSLLALSALLSASQEVSASKLISEMFSKYSSAQTMTGSIRLQQSVGQQGGVLLTDLQFERPGKLYINQTAQSPKSKSWLVTADGKRFSYQDPIEGSSKRLIETMKPEGKSLTIADVYTASSKSIGDRSVPLDIAIGRNEDLRFVSGQWASLQYAGSFETEGVQLHRIVGDWRAYGNAAVSGKFTLLMTQAHELKRYIVEETWQINGQSMPVMSVWNVDLKLNGAVDPSKFVVKI